MKAKNIRKAFALLISVCILISAMITASAATGSQMIIWNNAPANSCLVYRPENQAFVANTRYRYSFDFEWTEQNTEEQIKTGKSTAEATPASWSVSYFQGKNKVPVAIDQSNMEISAEALAHGSRYTVIFTAPADVSKENNIVLRFGGANVSSNFRIANLALWSIDENNNDSEELTLTFPETADAFAEKSNDGKSPTDLEKGEIGVWCCSSPKDGLTVEEQNGYFDIPKTTSEPDSKKESSDAKETETANWFVSHSSFINTVVAVLLVILLLAVFYLLHERKALTANHNQPELNIMNIPNTNDPSFPAPQSASGALGNQAVKIARTHNIGRRKNQEDSFGISNLDDAALCSTKGVMAVVADGMGGLHHGEDVSSIAVLTMLEGFSDLQKTSSGEEELSRLLENTVNRANSYLEKNGTLKKSGSTLMSVIVHHNALSWVSVGDSRISLFRNGRLSDLNHKHNYGAELDEMVSQNKISVQQALSNPDRDKLTSYIGMGKLKHIDISHQPMPLYKNDKVILMSDGIFNTLSDAEIEQILSLPIEQIGNRLESAVLAKQNPHQDNFTAVVLEISSI